MEHSEGIIRNFSVMATLVHLFMPSNPHLKISLLQHRHWKLAARNPAHNMTIAQPFLDLDGDKLRNVSRLHKIEQDDATAPTRHMDPALEPL